MLAGWDRTSATCDDGRPASNIDVAAGEMVTCTFANAAGVEPGYPRRQGATPFDAPLVVAYEPCATPDRTHAEPLAYGSRASPAQIL